MSPELFRAIVGLLVPYMQNAHERRALVESALYGCAVLLQIEWDGAAQAFTSALVRQLDTFGECHRGQPALITVLAELKKQVGYNRQGEIDQLIQRLMPLQQENRTMDATNLLFLLEVGRWAMSELKERWTLRRKEQTLELETMQETEMTAAAPALLADLSADKGQAHVERTLERIRAKRDLIEGWQDALVADQKQQQLGGMNLDVVNARKRDFNEKIATTLREIETDLGALGFTVDKGN